MSSVGAGGASDTQNTGRMGIMLKPRSERKLSADEIIQELRPKLATVPGMRVFLQNPPLIRMGGQLTKSLYQYTLQGTDIGELYRVSRDVQAKIAALPGLQDVTSDLQITSPKVRVEIDRDKASALGITAEPDRERPVQRLWHPTGLDDLHADQPVPGHPGAGSRLPGGPGRPLPALRPLRVRASSSR